MKGEINKEFYCSANKIVRDRMGNFISCLIDFGDETCTGCCNYHRKHPTPEQYKEEYGEEYHDDWAVYVLFETVISSSWTAALFSEAKSSIAKNPSFYSNIICACTPFGSPDDDWRPE